jgi:CBS domain-containing protein/sporulation protein YlmC with PRC-barrel domain
MIMSASKSIKDRIDGIWTSLKAGKEWAGFEKVAFFSQFRGMQVIDSEGRLVGRFKDFAIVPGETLLEVSGVVYSPHFLSEDFIVNKSNISSIDSVIKLKVAKEEIPPGKLSGKEMLVTDTLLDKQIVDIDGLKVVRVNDVLLAKVKNDLCLAGVDVGFNGILRRLGLLWITEHFNVMRTPNHIISWSYIDPLSPELRHVHLKIPRRNIDDLHPADIADIIEDLDNKGRMTILRSLDEETAAETMEEVEPDVQAAMIRQMNARDVAELLDNMNPNEAADILAKMPNERASEVLGLMSKEDASNVRELMGYRENSAGGMMNTEFVWVLSRCTVADVFERLRNKGRDIDMIYYVYVLDEKDHLIGVISLRDLMLSKPEQSVMEIMTTDLITVPPTFSDSEVADVISKYDFLAIPVVDNDGVLLGIITVDDALERVLPEDVKKQLPQNLHRVRRVHRR